ncbi:uncharacterized protein LOC124255537 [Haliotis rubra]|uniref:uncharacterized protein LOC124255537 n=1 Tax=Haliotis rubra TaxID=36100 RepID=UPI001EE5BEB4|nr:uncharacterized protein LOC124255537 [Haliotis rubra]
MATDNCWTLWQRLPPRYQLTTQEMADEEEITGVMGSRVGSPTPRSASSRQSPRYPSANPHFPGTTLAGIPPHTTDDRLRAFLDRRKLAFPLRNSRYLHNMKTLQRVNSARQKITSDPSIVTYVPSMRAKTLPAFPVTKLSNLQRATVETREYSLSSRNNFYQIKPDTGSHKVVAVHNIFPFDDSKSLARQSKDQSKKYVVNEMNDATMFIDNDKIIYFRKTKPNMTQSVMESIGTYSAKKNDGSYIAHLRKAYLKNPRDHPKPKEAEPDIHTIQRERTDYDKRVGHILDYYSGNECEKGRQFDVNRKTQVPVQTARTGSPRQRIRSSSPRSARLRSLLSTPVAQTPPSTRSCVGHMDPFEEWSLYFKLNQRSVLHEKQFYLRTPGIRVLIPGVQNITPSDVSSCKCRLCRVEMELSVIAQMNEMGIGIPSNMTSDPVSPPIPPEVECPGRPNSAANEIEKPKELPDSELIPNDLPRAKQNGELLTIKLPEISEETSDISSIATNRDTNRNGTTVSVDCDTRKESVSLDVVSVPEAVSTSDKACCTEEQNVVTGEEPKDQEAPTVSEQADTVKAGNCR